ncbi:MAG: hypothetical protein JRH05_05525 [Deltaproteobacteria bacterium]|nr:hypothetical protein [Deltaproteobacteria bacterium]
MNRHTRGPQCFLHLPADRGEGGDNPSCLMILPGRDQGNLQEKCVVDPHEVGPPGCGVRPMRKERVE